MRRTWLSLALAFLAIVAVVACSPDPENTGAPHATEPRPQTGVTTPAAPTATASSVPVPTASGPGTPAAATPTPTRARTPPAGLIRLADLLDDPLGYCVDVAGFGANLRLDAPLQAHTCKPGSDDQLFSIMPEHGVLLTQHDRCLTLAAADPGSPVQVERCDPGNAMQRFQFLDDGRILLGMRDHPPVCLGVASGPGEPAGGRNHLRRDLILYDCASADPALITWQLANQ